MNKLYRFLYNYGTDSVSALATEMARATDKPTEWMKATAPMLDALKDALRDVAEEQPDKIKNAYKMPVDEVKDLMLNHNW